MKRNSSSTTTTLYAIFVAQKTRVQMHKAWPKALLKALMVALHLKPPGALSASCLLLLLWLLLLVLRKSAFAKIGRIKEGPKKDEENNHVHNVKLEKSSVSVFSWQKTICQLSSLYLSCIKFVSIENSKVPLVELEGSKVGVLRPEASLAPFTNAPRNGCLKFFIFKNENH